MDNDYKPMRHVEMLHVGTVLSDSKSAITGTTPEHVPGTASVGFNPNGSVEAYKADGGTYDSATVSGDMSVSVRVAGLPLAAMGDLFGYHFDNNSKELVLGDPSPKDHFIKYRIQKNGGGWRYVTIFKSKMTLGEQTGSGEGTGFTDVSFEGVATKSLFKNGYVSMMDDDNLPAGVTADDLETAWFQNIDYKPTLPRLSGITVSASSASVGVGATERVTVTANYSDGSSADVTAYCALASSDDSKLSVAADGTITGIAAGTALKVNAIYGGKMAASSNIAVTA